MVTRRSSSKATAASLLVVAICGTVVFFSTPSTKNSSEPVSPAIESFPPLSASLPSPPSPPFDHRRLSKSLPDGGCELTWPEKPPPGTAVTYAASYPGCGARMTWNLVEALTGMMTGDDWNNNGRGSEVVTVKTHYPQSNGILVEFDEAIVRGFIVIRNPMKSIPSFFNHIYEMRNHLPVHSERAPIEEWVKWRNAYLDTEIAEYKKFIYYWMERYSAENRLLMTYEGLTDDLIGPEVAKGLNAFLGQVEGVTTVEDASVPCIWKAVVKNEPPAAQAAHIKKLQSLAVHQPQGGYKEPIEEAAPPQQPEQPEQQQYTQQQQPPPPLGQQIDQSLQAAPLQEQQQQLYAQQPIAEQQISQSLQAAPLQAAPLQEQQQQQYAVPNESQLAFPPQQPQYVQQPPPATYAPPQQQLYPAQAQQPLPPQQPGLRRRLDPGHHDTQRSGPQVARPYTFEELDKMLKMLLEVAQKYEKEDVRLYHIMMGYYEMIRGERLKINPKELVTPPGGFY